MFETKEDAATAYNAAALKYFGRFAYLNEVNGWVAVSNEATTNEMSQDYLKSILHYDPTTGIFTWRISRTATVKVGGEAGCINIHDGHRVIGIDGKNYMTNHLAWLYMTGAWPEAQVNHHNRQKDDNRWCNLRTATHQQNQWNRTKNKNNTSEYRGVDWSRGKRKWRARIVLNYKSKHLGYFEKKEDAARAYNAAAIKYFGEFAVLNEIAGEPA